jgi:hypothetical protein
MGTPCLSTPFLHRTDKERVTGLGIGYWLMGLWGEEQIKDDMSSLIYHLMRELDGVLIIPVSPVKKRPTAWRF